MPKRRCLGGCGRLIPRGTYCKTCHPYDSREWRQLSAAIIRRDDGICSVCGLPGADTAGHITQVAYGGTNDPANLKAQHRTCNSAERGA